MKTCPKCQTGNKVSSKFCKKCGSKLSDSPFEEKKEKILKDKKRSLLIPLSLAFISILFVGIGYWILSANSKADSKLKSQPKLNEKINYPKNQVNMVDIEAKIDGGSISIPIESIKKNLLVRFEYEGKGVRLPLLAYIAPSGRIITAISMCEPCRSTRFHIRDNKLICNACYTEWDLENLKGIRGGCLNYPPDIIPSRMEKNYILIDEELVTKWRPRA